MTSSRSGRNYLLCGWHVRSELELPDLPLSSEPDRPVDIEIVFGTVAETLDDPVHATPFMQVAQDGTIQIGLAGVGRYRLENGRRVVLAPAEGADLAATRVFLFGSVLGMLCHQRGLLPLHAAAVTIEGRVVALAGTSGAGKSTLCARLVQRGHRLITDDLCIIDPHEPSGPVLRPFGFSVKLRRDSLEQLGLDPQQLILNRRGQSKYLLPVSRPVAETEAPIRLEKVLILRTGLPHEADHVEWMSGFDRFAYLIEHVYRRRAAAALGRNAALFRDAARITGSGGARLGVFRRRKQFDHLDAQATLIEGIATAAP